MAGRRPATVSAYIEAAPAEGQAHLRRLHAILKEVAPRAGEELKWGTPFFVEPRFLFAFSAHKAHLGFMASLESLAPFGKELAKHEVTPRGILKIPYKSRLPVSLIRRIARGQLRRVQARKDDSFW